MNDNVTLILSSVGNFSLFEVLTFGSVENPYLQRYEVVNCNKITNAFFDIFGYCSLIDIQKSSRIFSENLI